MNHIAKIIYHREALDGFKQNKVVTPIKVQIDPVSFCNHDCPFCMFRYTKNDDVNALFDVKDMLPIAKMIEILDGCVDLGVKAIELTGGGEPSLHPEFVTILEEIRARDIDIGMVTNGAWREKHFDKIVDNLKDAEWVRFSLDAATTDTHRVVHASSRNDFQKACRAIDALSELSVTTGISFVVQKQNMHEVRDIVELGSKLGADYVRIAGVVFEAGRIEEIELSLTEHLETAEVVKGLIGNSEIKVYDDFSDRSCTAFPRYNKGDTCYYSHLSPAIGADGRLYLCCIWKYRPDGMIADLNKVNFADVWRTGILDKFYEDFDIAEKCVRCFIKPKNDFIHLMVSDGIEHPNFI